MHALLAGVVGAALGAVGATAVSQLRRSEKEKDQAAGKVLAAVKAGALPAADVKKVAVAFGVESVQHRRRGDHPRALAYQQAMMQTVDQANSQFGGGFHLGDVVRDVNAVVDYFNSGPGPTPDYPPVYAPDLYASGPYDYHMGPMYSQMPNTWRHPGRHY